MSALPSFNPLPTTNFQGTFLADSNGMIQGNYRDDPAVRFQLAGGIVSPNQTTPMFGGMGISEFISPGLSFAPDLGTSTALGSLIQAATSIAVSGASPTTPGSLTGFTVFNQAHAMIQTPQSQVPLAASGMSINYFRLGSGARIAVACDPALVSLQNALVTSLVSWDFALQRLIPYNAAFGSNVITAASWANTNGGQATLTTTTAHGIAVGSDFTVSGVTPAAYNGTFKAITGTTGSTLVYALPLATTPGAGTAFGSVVAGGGALPVQVLQVSTSGNMTVNFNPANNSANWNRSGPAALILI